VSSAPIRILHVTPQLSLGGAGRALLTLAKYSAKLGPYEHAALSLIPADRGSLELAEAAGVEMVPADQWPQRLAAADIVQIYFWNSPAIYSFLSRGMPAGRTLIWIQVNGEFAPQVLPADIGRLADFVIASDVATLRLPSMSAIPVAQRDVIPQGADFDRLAGFICAEHSTFNVGYIGTLAFSKMHPDYVAMHASIDVPDLRIFVYGAGRDLDTLKRQVKAIGAESRFVFPGYAHDIRSALAGMDVFGYPLSEHNYGTGELIVREVMYAGIPAVVLPFGGAASQIEHRHTGIVARDTIEYGLAIQELFENPAERLRVGRNAAATARRDLGAEQTARRFGAIYERMMQMPKRPSEPLRLPSADKEYTADDRTTGARLLITSLGEHGSNFLVSMGSNDADVVHRAEERIGNSDASMAETVLAYRNYFSNDPYLGLWSGLILLRMGRPAMAAAEFKRAITFGCDQWRSHWYLSQAAERSGSPLVAAEAETIARAGARSFGATLKRL
jgi:glycosyltransferase involved in cell wall biosynthesis